MGQQVNEFLSDESDRSDKSDKSDRGFFGDSKIRYFGISGNRLGIGLLAFVFFVTFAVGR